MTRSAVAVHADRIGPLRRLETLVRAVFGDGDRAEGWFPRKLERECVDPRLSQVLTTRPESPDDDSAWCGFALVGTPPSLRGVARTCGVGVAPGFRGRGLGTQLLEAVFAACREAGFSQVRTDAALDAVPFYRGHGYRTHAAISTWLGFGRGVASASCESGTHDHQPERRMLSSWLEEGWARTPEAQRWRETWPTDDGPLEGWLSQEGRAIACHRLGAPAGSTANSWLRGLEAFATRAPERTPLLLLGVDVDGALAAALASSSWSEVQRLALCTCALDASTR